jgi:DNA sulfur modification protein DndB
LENLRLALMRTHFFNSYDKDNNLIEHGFFDFGENDKTRPYILSLINLFFKKLLEEEELSKIWDEGDKGLILTNNMVGALINLLDDYLVILNKSYKLNTSLKIPDIISKLDRFIFALQHVLLSLSNEDKKFIKSSKGGSAPVDVKKRIGYLLSKELDEFTPEWLNDYIENYAQNNYHEAYQALDKLLVFLQNNIKESLVEIYNDKWELEAIDSDTNEELAVLKARAIRNNPNKKIEHLLEVSTFKELYKITTYKNHWSTVFKTKYQDDQKLLGEINPFVKLEKLYIKTEKKVSLSKTEFENLNLLIKKIYAENIKA